MKKLKYIVCALLFTAGLTSCDDFLEILPMNEVVLENYWTDKNDVTSVVNSCYESMESEDFLTRMGVWGELRSDNMKAGANVPNNINEILKENLLPTNDLCNWSVFYKTINYCNTVCHYAPMVQAIDPNYTESEMLAHIAEVSTLRALCYFYLVRTFRDVPYTTEPSIDDSQNYILPATPFNDVLDSLINNLESVKDNAVSRYRLDNTNVIYAENNSRITRVAIWALLADLYLWRGDWENCIKYCDMVIDFKRKQYESVLDYMGNITNIELMDSIPLIMEQPVGTSVCGNSYTEIFGVGNSFESLFELYFSSTQSNTNKWVANYYGNANNTNGRLSAPDFLRKDIVLGTNEVFKKTDGRAYCSIEVDGSSYYIRKYFFYEVTFKTQNLNTEKDLNLVVSYRGQDNANWIFYRLTDMLLIKAEALIQQGPDKYEEAFALINTVNKRANNNTVTLNIKDYVNTKELMEELLLAERHREFLFEGPRWFDLVRFARRDGNNSRLVALAVRKYTSNVNAIRIKLANPDRIYFPYAKSELKVNPLLKQNAAYADLEDSELTTN